jgi:hypothetical protein
MTAALFCQRVRDRVARGERVPDVPISVAPGTIDGRFVGGGGDWDRLWRTPFRPGTVIVIEIGRAAPLPDMPDGGHAGFPWRSGQMPGGAGGPAGGGGNAVPGGDFVGRPVRGPFVGRSAVTPGGGGGPAFPPRRCLFRAKLRLFRACTHACTMAREMLGFKK